MHIFFHDILVFRESEIEHAHENLFNVLVTTFHIVDEEPNKSVDHRFSFAFINDIMENCSYYGPTLLIYVNDGIGFLLSLTYFVCNFLLQL